MCFIGRVQTIFCKMILVINHLIWVWLNLGRHWVLGKFIAYAQCIGMTNIVHRVSQMRHVQSPFFYSSYFCMVWRLLLFWKLVAQNGRLLQQWGIWWTRTLKILFQIHFYWMMIWGKFSIRRELVCARKHLIECSGVWTLQYSSTDYYYF